jgi:hypothetical protein
MWVNDQLDSSQGSMYRPLVEAVFARRIHWVQWVGIALGLICTFFALRNYVASERIGSDGEKNVSFFSRILARFLD